MSGKRCDKIATSSTVSDAVAVAAAVASSAELIEGGDKEFQSDDNVEKRCECVK